MTRFFLAGADKDSDKQVEAAYLDLRERSLLAVGCAAKPRRIFKLDCRHDGSDCQIEVGRPLPHGGDLVVAILDHGRDEPYAVHTRDGAGDPTRVQRPVYDVTDFS
ncbi:MAG TPA: hypothetical protein VGH21_04865 [Solirubrobacteraceae bacterium]|jgi:hypothetical protein